jgi:uncharacterized membrane protein
MWQFMGLAALVLSIVAVALLKGCRNAIKDQQDRLDHLAQKINRIEKSPALPLDKAPRPGPQAAVEPSSLEDLLKRRVTLAQTAAAPSKPAPQQAPQPPARADEEAPEMLLEPAAPDTVTLHPGKKLGAQEQPKPFLPSIDRERWAKLEEKLGKEWITWVGAVVLFVAAGLFVKYAFDHKWLGPPARVILGAVAGIALAAAGERFIRRRMRALGQGLIGAGLAILYASLYAAYGLYDLLPQPVTFALMALVTIGGMILAVVHNAIAVSFLAVLGGFLTPVLLKTGRDPRDALFSYLMLLDIGVLGVAFFKRWRALDVLAFVGTTTLFTGWYIYFHNAPTYAMAPALLWLAAFYVVFLVQPFVYHLRLATPIVGERFFLAVSNAMGMFAGAYTILHPSYKHTLGFITIGMSASYLILGTAARKRIKTDERAVFGFIALSVALLTIAVPIHLDLHGVTVAWAIEAPLLLYLAYKFNYFPVRAGCLIPLALAAGRIFTTHWPLHSEAFTPILNIGFGTAIFVALSGAAYAVIHHIQKEEPSSADRILKIAAGIVSAFFALVVTHIEIWQWLQLSDRGQFVRWSAALVWVVGAAGFLTAGLKLRSEHSRASGFFALAAAGALCAWDYSAGIHPGYCIILNGRFLAALAATLVVFWYAVAYQRPRQIGLPADKHLANALYGIGIILLVVLSSAESWQCLVFHNHRYAARCLLPFLWAAGTAGCLFAGIRLRSPRLRTAGLVVLAIAGILAALGYWFAVPGGYILLFNWRFIAALAPASMVFTHAAALRKFRSICEPNEQIVSEALYGIGIFLLIVLATSETRIWLIAHNYHYLARCVLPLIWVAGAASYLTAGLKLRTARLRDAGLAVLLVAALLSAYGYSLDIHRGYSFDGLPFDRLRVVSEVEPRMVSFVEPYLFLNGRFAASLAVILMAFAHAYIIRRLRNICSKNEQSSAKMLYGIAIVLLFALLNVETYLYFSKTIADPEKARWITQMALSIVWGVYAAAILVIGFWRNARILRLSALALFGATALKLVIVDMAKVEDVYRIVSFFVLGILMIAASYLYHRVEKKLVTSAATAEKPK